jgi:hypothetical protein
MKKYFESLDNGSLFIMSLTFVLFLVAIFTKGFTHDILLETAVFLVSLKLIISTYKLSLASNKIQETIDETNELLKKHIEKDS